jgi:hypothetical protein
MQNHKPTRATSAAMPMLSPSVGGGVDSFADVYAICTQLDGQHYLADHVASIQKRRAFSWAGYRSR